MPEATDPRYDPSVLEYIRVANDLEARIKAGELRPGDKLPSEHAVGAEYEVAYSTARRAMKELRDRGLINTVWGKGTFVAQPKEQR
jgi:GntR family transcriptional regulator